MVPSSPPDVLVVLEELEGLQRIAALERVGREVGRDQLSSLSAVGRRSTKLGVNGKTRNGLVPELSLLESPRLEMLWVPLRLT